MGQPEIETTSHGNMSCRVQLFNSWFILLAICFPSNRIRKYLIRRLGSARLSHFGNLGFFSAMGKWKPSALSSEDDSDDVQSGIGSDVGELLTEMSKGMDAALMPPPSSPGGCSVALINVRSFMCAVLDL